MFILIEIAAAVSACTAPAPAIGVTALCSLSVSAAAVQPAIGGGWRDAPTDDEGVQAAANFAATQLGSDLSEVESASRQVVAGINYRLTLTLSDGRKFNVVVFRALNGTFSLTSSDEVGDTGGNDSAES